jgi:hypothetical protein
MFFFLWLWFISGAKWSLYVTGKIHGYGVFPYLGFYELSSVPATTLRAEHQPIVKVAAGNQKLLS